MDDLNSFKERLETNLNVLNKFEGLEMDLIQQHGNLRAQFSEYREAIEKATGIDEQDKREHYNHHDELIKQLHKLILVAKGLARKRTEQMTRDELFKLSQERQKSLKPQSVEDKIGEEMTKSLKRMLETMRSEVERSSANISTATSTTKHLKGTTENYENLSGTLEESRGLIRDLWKRNRNDMIYIIGALGVFVATVVYVIVQRTPGVVWLPGKLIVGQLANLIPKSREIVDKITEMTEAVLSDAEEMEEPPGMFIDTIEKEPQEEYGSDELLKNDDQIERSEPDMKNEQNAPSEHDHQIAIEAAKEVEAVEPPVELVESDKPAVEAISVAETPAAPSISIDEAVQSAAVEASNETNSSTDPVDDSDTQIPLNTLEALEEFITPTIEIDAATEIPEHLIATTSVTEIIEPTVASASIDGEVKPETVPGPIDRPKETGVTATSTTAADDSTSASTLHLADADESESDGDNEYYSDGESNSDTELKLEL